MAPPASIPNYGHALDGLFGRQKEIAELRSRLTQRKSFVLHGPPGSGKTFLLWHVIPKFSLVLYCADSSNPQGVFREIAAELLRDKNPRAARALGRPGKYIRQKSTIALRGIAMDVLHEAHYSSRARRACLRRNGIRRVALTKAKDNTRHDDSVTLARRDHRIQPEGSVFKSGAIRLNVL